MHDDEISTLSPREYWCFISYRQIDNSQPGRQWATWLHQSLENYEVPDDLVGTINERGDVIPERIFPVFRDEDELPADAKISHQIESALKRSRFLIVLCSPQAVASRWVADEILKFKQLGKQDRIIAAIIEGQPNVDGNPGDSPNQIECFPLPLRFEVDEDGQITKQRTEPLAADFRLADGSSGWTSPTAYRMALEATEVPRAQMRIRLEQYKKQQGLMLLKIIAGVLGVPLGLLTERDKAFRIEAMRKRAKALRRWIAALTILSSVTLLASVAALKGKHEAEVQQKEANRQRALALNNEAQAKIERDIARRARTGADQFIKYLQEDLLPELEKDQQQILAPEIHNRIQTYLDETSVDPSDAQGVFERIRLFSSRAQAAERRGEFEEAIKLLETADRMAEPFLGNTEQYAPIINSHANTIRRMSDVVLKTGQYEFALLLVDRAISELRSLCDRYPSVGVYLTHLAAAHLDRGQVLVTMNRKSEAIKAFEESIKAYEPLLTTSGLMDSIYNCCVSYQNMVCLAEELDPSSVKGILKDWGNRLESYHPNDADVESYFDAYMLYQQTLITFYCKANDWKSAVTEQEKTAIIATTHSTTRPSPKTVQLIYDYYSNSIDLSRTKLNDRNNVVRLLEASVNALKLVAPKAGFYQASRLLALAHTDIGDFYREAPANLDAALHHYVSALALMNKIRSQREVGPELHRDLAIAHQRLGILAGNRGDYEEAKKQHTAEVEYTLDAVNNLVKQDALDDKFPFYFTDYSIAVQNKVAVLVAIYKQNQSEDLLKEAINLIDQALAAGDGKLTGDIVKTDVLKEDFTELQSLKKNISKILIDGVDDNGGVNSD